MQTMSLFQRVHLVVLRRQQFRNCSSQHRQWAKEQIERFDYKVGVEKASTPPTTWYTDQRFYEFEQKALFPSNFWAGESLHLLEEPQSFATTKIANEPYLLVNNNGSVNGFFNVCRHHGTKVEWKECGKKELFSCPYHGWTYNGEGRLVKATRLRGIENFNTKCNGLERIDLFELWPMVFVKPRRNCESPFHSEEIMNRNARRIHRKLAEVGLDLPSSGNNNNNHKALQHVGRRHYDLKCNWKIFVDNYLDGGYHVQYAHKDLSNLLNSRSYKSESFFTRTEKEHELIYQWSVQTSKGTDGDSRVGDKVAYFHLFPNVMLNFYGPWLDVNYVIPTGAQTCRVIFDWFADASFLNKCDQQKRLEMINENIANSDKVQQEDIELCEMVQEGNQSSSYVQGRYAPKVEKPMFDFHTRLFLEYQNYLK